MMPGWLVQESAGLRECRQGSGTTTLQEKKQKIRTEISSHNLIHSNSLQWPSLSIVDVAHNSIWALQTGLEKKHYTRDLEVLTGEVNEISYVHHETSVEITLKGNQPCGCLGNWRTQYLQWPGTYINWRIYKAYCSGLREYP
jgi:hypothetical protein